MRAWAVSPRLPGSGLARAKPHHLQRAPVLLCVFDVGFNARRVREGDRAGVGEIEAVGLVEDAAVPDQYQAGARRINARVVPADPRALRKLLPRDRAVGLEHPERPLLVGGPGEDDGTLVLVEVDAADQVGAGELVVRRS